MFMGFYSVWIDIPEDVGGGSDRWYSKWSPAVRGDARMSGHAGPVTWQHPHHRLSTGRGHSHSSASCSEFYQHFLQRLGLASTSLGGSLMKRTPVTDMATVSSARARLRPLPPCGRGHPLRALFGFHFFGNLGPSGEGRKMGQKIGHF